MHPSFRRYALKCSSALLCAAAVLGAGCHHNNLNSGYGIAWVSLSDTDTPGQFASYRINVDSLSLTGTTYGTFTAVSAVETVDFTKLESLSELWSAASVPNDTYKSASITLDYTSANISVMVNGVPTKATVVDPAGAAVTTQTVNMTFDPQNPLVVQPTLSSSSAQRLAINFNLAVSNVVDLTGSTPKVTVKPFMTIATSAPDTKPIRVRGPLINSSVGDGTYTVYVRPFFDEVNSLGQLTMFNDANTVYQINGKVFVGTPGITALSQSSAGSTITAAYTRFTPTNTLNPAVTAGKFLPTYVIAGSTLEDFYTQGIEGDVIKRVGNTLTLRGATLQLNDGSSAYIDTPDAVVLLGPATIVTAEDSALTGLDYNSVSVGQHIIARGIYSLPASGVTTLDATGSSSTNTGSVRLQKTQLFGPLVSATPGTSLVMNLETIETWPVGIYDFTGNGAAAVAPAAYTVATGALAVPAGAVAADPLWIDGLSAPFGSAPPDFQATAIDAEPSVPASLHVEWTPAGTITPFATSTSTGLTINLADPNYSSGVIRIGSESIDLQSLAVNPTIVPAATPAATPGLPAVFLPLFAIGNLTATAGTIGVTAYNTFATFAAQLPASIVAATPALQFAAVGVYDRAANTFTATSIDVVN